MLNHPRYLGLLTLLLLFSGRNEAAISQDSRLGDTAPLVIKDDIASVLVSGVDRFLLQQIEEATKNRITKWKNERSVAKELDSFQKHKRSQLAHLIGVRDTRISFESPELVSTLVSSSRIAASSAFDIHVIRMPVIGSIELEGLLLLPVSQEVLGSVVVVPDADASPESMCGLVESVSESEQVARRFAECGYRVVVPTMISRKMKKRRGRANLTNREFLYRSAFEMGRHLVGYEIQKILAAVDWFEKDDPSKKVCVWGRGEGGQLTLYAAALDTRIDMAVIDDFLGTRKSMWSQPISRNLFGLLNDFGDAECLRLIAPRAFVEIGREKGLRVNLPSQGGAPGAIVPATKVESNLVFEDFHQYRGQGEKESWHSRSWVDDDHAPPVNQVIAQLSGVGPAAAFKKEHLSNLKILGSLPDAGQRMQRQMDQIDRFSQTLLAESENVRRRFIEDLDTSSVENFELSAEKYREVFAKEVIGQFDLPLKEFNPRVRKFSENQSFTGYEVVLDVFDEVIAYGILLIPNDLKAGQKRPVVVCQHGLEGRPQDIVQGDHPAYHDFAAKLATEGLITFSPQNLYIFTDRFRTLQRKANSIGKTLFSVIVPQHQQIVNWLKTLPNVDAERIAFYGLSYGGKSAMRIPPLVKDYCLSICSADFNDWIWKNASTKSPYSYVWTGEYEIFEFDLGNTFNYFEMAALIAPRPFMVERGHFDGVSSDERVAYEFAKVRHLYQAKLGIGNRCEIEFFVGPHTINGKGTFKFLRKHLKWPESPR